MRLLPAFLLCLTMVSVASATVITLGVSNQALKLTGIGPDKAGAGQNVATFGTCVYDGTITQCTVTGPYTGLNGGGTYTHVLSYNGNGTSPLTLNSITPGSETVVAGLSAGSFTMTLAGNDGTNTTFYYTTNWNFQFQNVTCTGVTTCAIGTVGQTKGATITGQFTGTFDTAPVIISSGVISAGQYGGFQAISPGTWIEIYGYNVGTVLSQVWGGADFKGNQAPMTLAGTTVTIGGQPAYVDFVSPGQVNANVPTGIATGQQPLVVTTAGGNSVTYTVTVNATEPGLLAPTVFNLPGGQYIAALLPDGTTFVLPPGTTNQVRTVRAKPGDTIILYGVGFGAVTPTVGSGQITQSLNALQQPFQIFFNGTQATVQYAGLVSGYVGLYQFNVVVPNVAASDTVPVTFTLGGAKGPQNLVIPIGN